MGINWLGIVIFILILAISAAAAYFASRGLLDNLKKSGNKYAKFWSVLTFILSFFAMLLIILLFIASHILGGNSF
jgi:hypothetical protein